MSDWETLYTEEGHTYYYNRITNETSWELPKESKSKTKLPPNWEECSDGANVYYYNSVTGETTWDLPTDKTQTKSIGFNKPSSPSNKPTSFGDRSKSPPQMNRSLKPVNKTISNSSASNMSSTINVPRPSPTRPTATISTNTSKKFCTQCGATITGKFCTSCGANNSSSSVSTSSPSTTTATTRSFSPPPRVNGPSVPSRNISKTTTTTTTATATSIPIRQQQQQQPQQISRSPPDAGGYRRRSMSLPDASSSSSSMSYRGNEMSGYLTKLGHVMPSWKRRYFILKGNTLSYYKKQGDITPLGVINITGAKIEVATYISTKQNAFAILVHPKDYFIHADSPDEMRKWMDSLKEVAGTPRKR